jgi:hypothetical protein
MAGIEGPPESRDASTGIHLPLNPLSSDICLLSSDFLDLPPIKPFNSP